MLVQINGADPFVGVSPIPEPITVKEQSRFGLPTIGPGAFVNDLADFAALSIVALGPVLDTDVSDAQEAFIRAARQLLGLAIKEQLVRRMSLKTAAAGKAS